jgi:hypothetical protein
MFLGKRDRLFPVDRFGAKVVFLFDFEHLAEALSDCGVVVGYQDRLGHQRSAQKAGISNPSDDLAKLNRK